LSGVAVPPLVLSLDVGVRILSSGRERFTGSWLAMIPDASNLRMFVGLSQTLIELLCLDETLELE